MKKYLLLMLLASLSAGSYAQTTSDNPKKVKKHTTAKKKIDKVEVNSSNHNTVVEIKDDKIYVDGEVVSTISSAKNEDHKIVISHKGQHKKHNGGEAWEHKERRAKPESAEKQEQQEPAENGNAGLTEMNKPYGLMESNSEVTTEKPFDRMPPKEGHNALLGVYSANSGNPDGAYIARVMHNSPAAAAGLAQGDVITKVNETAINNSDELVATIGMYHPGDEVVVTYTRNGNKEEARVELGNKEVAEEQAQGDQQPMPMHHHWQGNGYNQNYNDGMNDNRTQEDMSYNHENLNGYNHFGNYQKPVRLGISASDGRRPRGVYLDEVKPESPAEEAGLQKGDIITRVNGERVKYAYEMQELLNIPNIGNVIDIDYRHNGERMRTQVHIISNNNGDRDYRNHRRMDYENDRMNGNYNYER